MESRAKLLGHSIHQSMIVLPLGLLLAATGFDIAFLITGRDGMLYVAFWTMAVGVLSGFVAAVFGIIDWFHIPKGTRAAWIGGAHGVANIAAIGLFTINAVARGNIGPTEDPGVAMHVITYLACAILLVGGWLGGELVDRLGVGVDNGAHLNAPNSIMHKDAHGRARPQYDDRSDDPHRQPATE